MTFAVTMWMFFRVLRWASWLYFLGFAIYFVSDRQPHLNSFGHLLPITELQMFGSGLVAVFAGFLELMMREKAGIQRPVAGPSTDPINRTTR
jgi:hypothetical protein